VSNSIQLEPDGAQIAQVKAKVEAALQRQATTDAKTIEVTTSGGKVTLTGHASSWGDRGCVLRRVGGPGASLRSSIE
jgi:osmotically-inducible protein OsmY